MKDPHFVGVDTVVELDISKRYSGDLPKILNALPVED